MDDVQAIRARRDEVARRYGDWTAHDIRLADGLSTRPGGGDPHRLRRCLQLAADLTGRPIDDLRVLDLGARQLERAIALRARDEAVEVDRHAGLDAADLRPLGVGRGRRQLVQAQVAAVGGQALRQGRAVTTD